MARKLLVVLWKYVTAGVGYRGSFDESRQTMTLTESPNLPGPNQSWRIQVDDPQPRMAQKSRPSRTVSSSWAPSAASGILVQ
jgi:hypothetical protein